MQLTGSGLCLELNRAGEGRADNRYRFVFGTEKSRREGRSQSYLLNGRLGGPQRLSEYFGKKNDFFPKGC